jgi:Tfp pilus assembly protein PilP
MGGILIVLMIWGVGMSGLHAADMKTPPPAAPPAGSGKPETKTPPALVPAAGKVNLSTPVPAAAKPGPAQVPAGAKAGTGPVPPVKVATQDYKIKGKTDPFKPFMETDPAVKLKKEEELKKKETLKIGRRPISPLQQAEITQFRLVGIAGSPNRRTAVVEDGAVKKYYPLFIGTYIGRNEGRVSAIMNDRVIVEERVESVDEDLDGKQTKKAQIIRVTLMLHKEDEGKQ